MMIKTVFLDMDGVITNFNKAVCTEFGLPYPPQDYYFFPEIRKEVNEFCNMSFWRNLEWMDDGRDILRAIMDTFELEKVYFLTGIMPNVESGTGKLSWISDNLSIYSNRVILHTLGISKSSLAKPNTILIDDYDKNIAEFTAAGGYGILINRPWNAGHERADHTVSDLELDLLDLPGGPL